MSGLKSHPRRPGIQTQYPPLHSADLFGGSFEDLVFVKTDFRNAGNLDKCEFTGATALESNLFGSDKEEGAHLLGGTRPGE